MQRRASVLANDALLLLTATIWGFAFVAQRVGMEHVGPFTYNAVRFALGALALVPLIIVRGARSARLAGLAAPAAGASTSQAPTRRLPLLPAGLLAGGVLFVGASLQQVGLLYTTAGKAGFITGLYVVLVPLSGLLWGQRAGGSAWAGAALSVVGLFLLSMTSSFTIARGDLLVLVGAFFWAAHVQVVGWLSPRVDPVRLSCIQFVVCSLLCWLGALFTETVAVSGIFSAAIPILYGGVMSVGIAYTLQVVAQRSAPPAHAAILLSLESVFAAIGGGLILGERLGARGTTGCLIMFAGMLVSQVPLIVGAGSGKQGRPAGTGT
jgi:drug/metabolite transporter (DMT)-like permease